MLKLKLQYFGHLMQRADSFERHWCWERLRAGEEGDDRGWDGWMASLTQWAWVWVYSGSWWWAGRPGVLWFMGLQRVRHDWATELNWTGEAVVVLHLFQDVSSLLMGHKEIFFLPEEVLWIVVNNSNMWEQVYFKLGILYFYGLYSEYKESGNLWQETDWGFGGWKITYSVE